MTEAELTDARLIDTVARELSDLYRETQDDLTKLLTSEALTAFERFRVADLLKQVKAARVALDKRALDIVSTRTPQVYERGTDVARAAMREIGINPGATVDMGAQINTASVQAIVDQMSVDLLQASAGIEKGAVGFIRRTQQTVVSERAINAKLARGLLTGERRRDISRELVKEFTESRILINGRRYEADKYVDLVTRTRMTEAHSNGMLNTTINAGLDLVQVSVHSHPREDPCSPFQGKVFSISGTSPDFPPLTKRPPYHPNCRHRLVPISAEYLEAKGQLDALKRLSNSRGNGPATFAEYAAAVNT